MFDQVVEEAPEVELQNDREEPAEQVEMAEALQVSVPAAAEAESCQADVPPSEAEATSAVFNPAAGSQHGVPSDEATTSAAEPAERTVVGE